MFKIEIYSDKNGKSEIEEFFDDLNRKAKTSKFSRVRLKKIVEYIEVLKAYGTHVGEPIIKHITNTGLWELRPTRDRIFFAHKDGNTFLLLHHFLKKSQKTPAKEITRAKNYLIDYLERSNADEN